jgi:hypothetical protein
MERPRTRVFKMAHRPLEAEKYSKLAQMSDYSVRLICHTCAHRAIRQINGFAIWGCIKLKLRFGNETDFRSGKWMGEAKFKDVAGVADMPEKCKHFKS